ncbi:MAG TPA: hypothetical protein VMT03_27350 [Polyangia bacterium]|nr:hypothetical protein [Polyangia bacterium]
MKTFTVLSAVVLSLLTGCTIVAPGGPDAGKPIIKIVPVPRPRPDALPPPKPLEASVLYVVNLQRSSANLANQYAGIITGLASYWEGSGLSIVNMGLIATYADQFGPRLLLGRNTAAGAPASSLALLALLAGADAGAANYQSLLPLIAPTLANIDDGDIGPALQLFAASGNFDGNGEVSEAKNVIEFGRGLSSASLPAALGGIDRSAFFDVPHDLFIVVYLQPLPRRCALGTDACSVDGRSPADIFAEADSNGNAAWLSFASGGMPVGQVVQLSVATSEGESESAFQTRCKAVPGFPTAVLDVIGPSSNAYFTPLMQALNSAHSGTGHSGDFCTLIGSKPQDAITALGSGVAALAVSN